MSDQLHAAVMGVPATRPAAPPAAPPKGRFIGQPVPRVEDRPLLLGQGEFVDDVERPGQVYARIIRSPLAHGRITGIDATEALKRPGVIGVFTAAEMPDVRIPIRLLPSPEGERVLQPPIARDVVRYVGEPVAVLVAEDPYLAEDAAEDVVLDIEPLDVVLDPVEAAGDGSTLLHPEVGGNVVNTITGVHGRDVRDVFAEADVIVRDRLLVARNGAMPLETRGFVAEYDERSGGLTVWGPAKVKHFNRTALADMLSMPVESIRFIEPDVGGGFGARGEFYPEDFLIPWTARRIGRPVKWTEDRAEHFVASNHARELVCEVEMAASAEGRLLAFRARGFINQGAYTKAHGGVLLPRIAVRHIAGPYAWDGYDVEMSGVLTNKTPMGTYRGPSQYEAAFFRERMIDVVAARLGIEPAELRRRNLVPVEDMPYLMELGGGMPPVIYDSGDYPLIWDQLMTAAAERGLESEVAGRRARGELVGIGVAAYMEEGGVGPWEIARIVAERDGTFTVHVGIAAVGQGVRTALTQIAAESLDVPLARVNVSHHDTDVIPEGFGAFASRTTVMSGNAIVGAVRELEAAARAAAAERLRVPEDEVEVSFADGTCAAGEATVPIGELGCAGESRFDRTAHSFSMGGLLAVVSIDPETGGAVVERILMSHDAGRVVNPTIVNGQLVGSAVQGAAGALLESLPFDENGQPLATSFMDYLMPTAAEAPPVEAIVLELPHHHPPSANPLGVKGASEGGIVGMGAVIANAVAAALGSGGEDIRTLPISPELLMLAARPVSSS